MNDGYIKVRDLLDFCDNQNEHSITPNDIMRMNRVGWISARDRLPEAEGSTLICTEKGAVCTAKFYPKTGKWNGWAGKNARYWMPLPEGPKEA